MTDAAPHSELTQALAADIRAIFSQLKRQLRAQSNAGEVTPSQAEVLLLLERGGPASVSDLSQAAGIRPQSMGATVAALEEIGYLARTPDPQDGRRTILSLTDACRQWLAEGRAARSDWLSRSIAGRLTPAEQAELESALRLLKRLVDT